MKFWINVYSREKKEDGQDDWSRGERRRFLGSDERNSHMHASVPLHPPHEAPQRLFLKGKTSLYFQISAIIIFVVSIDCFVPECLEHISACGSKRATIWYCYETLLHGSSWGEDEYISIPST